VHPKSEKLGFTSEKVTHLACSSLRCTVATLTNKVASFVDESVGAEIANHLDTQLFAVSCQNLQPADQDTANVMLIKDVYASHHVSCARTKSGTVFWW